MALPLHLTPRQAGALAAIARPRTLVLTHFYPPVEAVDIVAEVAEQYRRIGRTRHRWLVLDL